LYKEKTYNDHELYNFNKKYDKNLIEKPESEIITPQKDTNITENFNNNMTTPI